MADKKYKCPYCDNRYTRDKLTGHIQRMHEDIIPTGYTASRIAFNTINKKEVGHCIMCGNVTMWNEEKKRYERLCNSPKCKKDYIKLTEERLQKARGVTKKEMLDNPEFQNKMLKGRSISGTYKFTDGGKLDYVGSYEKNFLEFMDKYLHVQSTDIQSPGPTVEYYFEGKKHFWITDYYYIPYNLVFDIKDGGKNPNRREMPSYRAKQYAKEQAITQSGQYNYIRLTNNQFDQLLEIMIDLKDSLTELDGPYHQKLAKMKPIIRINEVFVPTDPSFILFKVLDDPETYLKQDISTIENYYAEYYNHPDMVQYRKTTFQYVDEFVNEYQMYLYCGKCSYDVQAKCEEFKAAGVTLNDVLNIGFKLKKLFNFESSSKLNSNEDEDFSDLTHFDQDYLRDYVLNTV